MNIKQTAHRHGSLAPGHILILLEMYTFPYANQCTNLLHDMNGSEHFTNGLKSWGLIESDIFNSLDSADRSDNVPYLLTNRGKIYVESLRRVRLPVQKWVPGDRQ